MKLPTYLQIIADVHGNLEALNAVLNAEFYNETKLVFAGDLLDYGSEPAKCWDIMKPQLLRDSFDHPIGILGNHDIAVITEDYSRFNTEHGRRSAKWSTSKLSCKSLRDFVNTSFNNKITINNKLVMVCHGSDIDEWQNVFPKNTQLMDQMIERNPGVKLFIVAHSHLQFAVEHKGVLFLNPGSVGQSRNGVPKAHYALMNTQNGRIELKSVDYDIKSAANKIHNVPQLDDFLATRLYLGI